MVEVRRARKRVSGMKPIIFLFFYFYFCGGCLVLMRCERCFVFSFFIRTWVFFSWREGGVGKRKERERRGFVFLIHLFPAELST